MAELRAPEQNRLLGQLARMLRTTEGDIAAPEFLPKGLDVMGLVRQLMLPSAETVEKLSYGDPLFRMPTQSNIPITADREYLADVAGMIPFGAPAARPSARAMQDLVRQIQTEPPTGAITPRASLLDQPAQSVGESNKTKQFLEMAEKGRLQMAKDRSSELKDLKEGKSKFAELSLNWDDPQTYDLVDEYAKDGFKTKVIDRGGRNVTYLYKNEKDIKDVLSATTPADYGRAYGYSDEDIARFYLERGLGPEDFFEDMSVVENPFQTAFTQVSPGDEVAGLTVREYVPNIDSISASLENYEVLSGIRKVPARAFDAEYLDSLRAGSLDKRTADLSEQIKQSKEINPLIVAVDSKGAYIIEGGHRFDALMTQGRESVPAKVVIDQDDPPTEDFLRSLFQ
jgi:uncharacterized ParB-like nuclease family protein